MTKVNLTLTENINADQYKGLTYLVLFQIWTKPSLFLFVFCLILDKI